MATHYEKNVPMQRRFTDLDLVAKYAKKIGLRIRSMSARGRGLVECVAQDIYTFFYFYCSCETSSVYSQFVMVLACHARLEQLVEMANTEEEDYTKTFGALYDQLQRQFSRFVPVWDTLNAQGCNLSSREDFVENMRGPLRCVKRDFLADLMKAYDELHGKLQKSYGYLENYSNNSYLWGMIRSYAFSCLIEGLACSPLDIADKLLNDSLNDLPVTRFRMIGALEEDITEEEVDLAYTIYDGSAFNDSSDDDEEYDFYEGLLAHADHLRAVLENANDILEAVNAQD